MRDGDTSPNGGLNYKTRAEYRKHRELVETMARDDRESRAYRLNLEISIRSLVKKCTHKDCGLEFADLLSYLEHKEHTQH